MDVLDWLLASDPALAWQVERMLDAISASIDWSSRHRKRLDQFVYRDTCEQPERE